MDHGDVQVRVRSAEVSKKNAQTVFICFVSSRASIKRKFEQYPNVNTSGNMPLAFLFLTYLLKRYHNIKHRDGGTLADAFYKMDLRFTYINRSFQFVHRI